MEDSISNNKIVDDYNDLLIDEEKIYKKDVKEVKNRKSKKFHALENNLIDALLDPMDSDLRRRYIKKWVYGYELKNKVKKDI